MEKLFELKGTAKKQRKQARILVYITLCACAIAVQHEQWICLGMQRHTHITLCNLLTLYPYYIYICVGYWGRGMYTVKPTYSEHAYCEFVV